MINQSLIQFNVRPDEYLKTMHAMEKITFHEEEYPDYIKILPEYIISKCPICEEKYIQHIDTYTLRKWIRPTDGDFIFLEEEIEYRCDHFVVIQYFINCNGFMPEISENELSSSTTFNSEVPHVLGVILESEPDCRAVIHSLPICKIENNEFVHKYSLYMITYYAAEENIKNIKIKIEDFDPGGARYERLIWPPDEEEGEIWWDLNHWVREEKLLWLEPENPNLPIRTGLEGFPYGSITGRKSPYFAQVPPPKPMKKRGLIGRIIDTHFYK